MSKRRSTSRNILRNFLCGNSFQQLEVACTKHVSERILSIHCQPILQSVSANFSQSRQLFWPPCGILYIKQHQKLLSNWRSFNWPNLKEAVFLIRTTRKRILSLLNILFSCRNRLFTQLIVCRKRLLQKLQRKIAVKVELIES